MSEWVLEDEEAPESEWVLEDEEDTTEQWMGETGERPVSTAKGLGLGVPNIGTVKEMGKAALQGVVGDPIRAGRGAIEATDPEGVVDVVPGMGVGHMSAMQ